MGRRPTPKKKQKRLFKHPAWQQCYEHFLAQLPSQQTRILYDARLRHFFSDGIPPDRKTRADVENWLMAPTAGPARPGLPASISTQNGRLRIIKSFYGYASQYLVPFRGKLRPLLHSLAPTTGIRRRKEPYPDRDMAEGEAQRLLDVIDRSTPIGARDYCIFAVLLITARRISEILHLQWKDIEQARFVENGRIKQGWLYRFQGKGHLSKDDCAEWPAECMQLLREYLQLAGHWDDLQPDDYLFVSLFAGPGVRHEWPDEPVRYQSIDKRFRRYADLAGIPRTVVVHSLRHESAWERHEANGHNLEQVRADLRHSSILTTMRYIYKSRRKTTGDPVAAQLAAKYLR